MQKILRRVLICVLLAVFGWSVGLIADRHQLSEGLIRLHVVANSDSEADQYIKLQVRDAVLNSLREDLEKAADMETAKAYLQENLPNIERIANEILDALGVDGEAVATLCKESFSTRYYDTFTLPAGVYESLRISIGKGEGHNWWCVVFPSFCVPATTEGFSDTAVSAGFSETLTDTLTEKEGYEVRFYLLDVLGKLENIFYEE